MHSSPATPTGSQPLSPSAETPTIRPRRRRKRARFPYVLRIATVICGGGLVAWCAFLILAKTLHPYLLGHEESTRIAAMREHLDHQNSVNAGLQARVEYLESDEGRESEARRRGFHRPGEIVYLLKAEDTAATTAVISAP